MKNNILKYLKKYYKEGEVLYSPLFGNIIYNGITTTNKIVCEDQVIPRYYYFDMYGRYIDEDNNIVSNDCFLFPKKEVREWETV